MAKKKQKENNWIGFAYFCRQCGYKEVKLKECPKCCGVCNSEYLTIVDHSRMATYFSYNEYLQRNNNEYNL